MRHRYSIYGVTASLPSPCPWLSPAEAPDDDPGDDVVCALGEAPTRFEAPELEGPDWQATARRFLRDAGPESGRLLVEDGRSVLLQPSLLASAEQRLYLMVQVGLPVALIQRGVLVLHAAVAVADGRAFAVCGASGAGKSSTLAALLARGCAMLSDDVAAVRLGCNDRPETAPGAPQLSLFESACERIGWNGARTGPRAWRRMKVSLATEANMGHGAAPLQAIYVLSPGDGDAVRATPLHGSQRAQAIGDAISGPVFPAARAAAFPTLAAVLQTVATVRIERPTGRWSVSEVADLILSDIGGR